jgi:hypothetical protein
MKLITMADGLFLYKTDTGYKVENPDGVTLKEGKTIQTCNQYINKELQARRTAERYASLNNIPTNIPST